VSKGSTSGGFNTRIASDPRATRIASDLVIATLVFAFGFSCIPASARAQQEPPLPPPPSVDGESHHRLVWNEDWPRFRPIGYVVTSASVLSALAVTLFLKYPDEPRWSGGILFDDAVRDGLRARDPGLRDAIRIASDITLATTLVQVALVDSLLIPFADDSSNVAAQLSLMNAQALSLNILVATLLFKAVARERPLIQDCKKDPAFDPLCSRGSYASFPSSHTSTAFTAAGLACVHHAYLPIYGGEPWDTSACIASLTFATATGVFRIVGDRHYATDVLFGAAIGFSLGYIYPWLLHYRFGKPMKQLEQAATWGVMPAAPYGLQMAGEF
jgi:membrane-associated phospholipid phosphatase